MIDSITIRKVTEDELIKLQSLSRKTFYDSFAGDNSKENMDMFLETAFSELKLARELKNDFSDFFFAIYQGVEIGYLKINYEDAQTELREKAGLELERIYVLQNFQGLKVGALLLKKAIDIAREKKLKYVWLGVWEKNVNAIRFYEKHGFRKFDSHKFWVGDDEQTDLMMKFELE